MPEEYLSRLKASTGKESDFDPIQTLYVLINKKKS